MLATNLLKMLNGLAHIASPDIAIDLSQDLVAMLNHSRAHIRTRGSVTLGDAVQGLPGVSGSITVQFSEIKRDVG